MLSTLAFSFSSWVVTALSSWPRLSFWSVSSRTSSSSSSTRLLAAIVVFRSSSKLFLVISGEATAPWSPAGQEGELLPARVVPLGALQLLPSGSLPSSCRAACLAASASFKAEICSSSKAAPK